MNPKKEKILAVASELFFEHGFHATGIDTIVAQSGITKKTLYYHFPSKAELILAKVFPGCFYGLEGGDLSDSQLATLSAAIIDAFNSHNDYMTPSSLYFLLPTTPTRT